MCMEKNVCDQIIHMIMNIKGKTKDDVNIKSYMYKLASEVAGGQRVTMLTALFALNRE